MGTLKNIGTFLRTGAWPFEHSEEYRAALQEYSSIQTMAPQWALTDADSFIRDGVRKNALVYRAVEFVASSVATPVLRAMRESGDGFEELNRSDFLAALLQRPSEEYGSQTRFIKQVVRSLLVTGEAILYKAKGERTGQVAELQILPPHTVAVKREKSGKKIYLYHYDPARDPIKLKPEAVMFIKFDDLLDKDRGLAPLQAAARETDVDNSGADVRKGFFDNGAVLSGILSTEQEVGDEQLKNYSATWSEQFGGSKNAGKTPALGGGLKYQEIGTSPDKIAFPEVIGISEVRICQAFGVSPILVGAKIGLEKSTYSNYETAFKSFWQTIAPALLTFLADEFTGGLTERADGRVCRWDTSEVPALQEDEDKREQRAGRILKNAGMTLNQYKEENGLETTEDGDVYLVPSGFTLVNAGELNVDRTPEALKPENLEDENDSETDGEGDTESGEDFGGGDSAGDSDSSRSVLKDVPRRSIRQIRAESSYPTLEKRLAKAIEDVFGAQAESVADKVADTLDPDKLLDLTIEAERTASAVRPKIRAILNEAGEEAAKEVDGEFDREDEETTSFVAAAALLLGVALVKTTRDLIGKEVARLQTESPNLSLDEIGKRLKDTIVNRDRADLAASTETVRTANRAGKIALKQNGITQVVWRNGSDPCEFCRELEGKVVGIDEAFAQLDEEVSGADGGSFTVSYETAETPPLHPDCSCFIEPVRS